MISAMYAEGSEPEFVLPTLARCVQDMAKGTGTWAQVAKAALDEFVAPLQILSFAALERARLDEPFRTVLSHELPLLPVGRVGPRATIASFVEAAATPGQVFITENVGGVGALACAALPADSGPLQMVVLAGRVPAVTKDLLAQLAAQFMELLRPAAGGAAAREPADAVSIAIRRAKREWETVADGLPALVGLADAAGRVLRVNRSWTRVAGAGLGRSIHSLLHSGCSDPKCPFGKRLAVALDAIPRHRKVVVYARDDQRDADWAIHLRYKAARMGRGARIVFSISEVSEAERALRKQHAEKAVQAHRQFSEQLRESLAHTLSAAQLGIESAMDALRRGGSGTALDELGRCLALIQGLARDRPAMDSAQGTDNLEKLRLSKNLKALCAAWSEGPFGKDVSVSCAIDDRNVPKNLWLPIYRIVQESLNHAVQPAGARNVGVALVPGDIALLLAIEYDGIGLATGDVAGSPGLSMIRELAEFSGGTFRVDSTPDGGTTIEVLWPRLADVSRAAVPSVH